MKTSIKYLQKYSNSLIDKYWSDMPKVFVYLDEKLSRQYGGYAHGSHSISIPKWMLADKKEAMGTIRHELAHNLIFYLKLGYKILHGKEFKEALRVFSPKNWQSDLHWTETPAITQARIKVGINPREHHYLQTRLFTCGNPNCTERHLWGFKRVPDYIKRGLFAVCKCGCPDMVEKGGKHTKYTSVHGIKK